MILKFAYFKHQTTPLVMEKCYFYGAAFWDYPIKELKFL